GLKRVQGIFGCLGAGSLAVGMFLEAQRNFVEHDEIGAGRFITEQPRHHGIKPGDKIVGAIILGAVAALPEIDEELVVAIGAALVLAVFFSLGGLAGAFGGNGLQFSRLRALACISGVVGNIVRDLRRK